MQNSDLLPGRFVSIHANENQFLVITDNGCHIRIMPIHDNIIRVRYSTDGYFENDI